MKNALWVLAAAVARLGAYAGRAPFQLGKPIGAIVGPYRIRSVEYHAIAVTTNKTVQEAVRGFGQAPTNYALERAIDEVAASLALDPIEVRRRNFIRSEEFPYTIPSGTAYDSGDYHTVVDKTLARADSCATPDHPMIDSLWAERRSIAQYRIALRGRKRAIAFTAANSAEGLSSRLRGILR